MPTLILNAGTATPINLVVQQANEGAPTEVGTVTPSFNAADRSSVRGVKRNYGSLTSYLDTATKDSVINLLKWGKQIPCSGDLLANIQTQCTVRYTGAKMIAGLTTGLWEVGLSLSEVQPNVTLLRYAPGDTITGESFSRSTTATYFNLASVMATAAINEKRDSSYADYPNIGGTRRLRLEGARTNPLLWASDQSNAAWTKTNMSVTTGVPGMRTGTSACTLTATAATGDLQQFLSVGSSLVRTNSIWMRRRTGTGQVELYAPDGTTFTVPTLTANYQRVQVPGPATTARKFEIIIRTSGDAIDVENAQMDDGAFPSTSIQTTSAAVPRTADFYSLPFTQPPAEMTVYAKFVELGTALSGGRVFGISSAADANPILYCAASSGKYVAVHSQTSGSPSSALAVGPSIGDTVEIIVRLFGDGSVDITQSINGGAATSGAQSAALALATAWSGQLVWLNSDGTNGAALGFTDLQSFKIIAGARSLSEMRAA